jgi:L-methionine (R)-S-oxide reductase
MSTPVSLPPAVLQSLDAGSPAQVLAATIAHFQCAAGTLHRLEGATLSLVASQNIPPQIQQIVQTVPVGKGIAGLAAQREEPITLCNLQTDTSGQARPAAKQTGMEGSIAVPMHRDGTLVGVLGIAKPTAHDWTPEETSLLLAIGAELAKNLATP